MKLFNKLMTTIFGHGSANSAAAAPAATTAAAASSPATQPGSAAAASPATAPSGTAATETKPAEAPGAGAQTPTSVDVNAVLNDLASKNSEKLDWKKSIVDLMKLVGMDSSLSARKELATELGYTGNQSDSATMNVWLHKQVLRKLAENGGKVPQDLLD